MSEKMPEALSNANWIRLPSGCIDNRTCAVPPNLHTFFRHSFNLDTLPEKAMMAISADDCARLYVNGSLAWVGPAAGYLHRYFYATIDLRPFLRPGKNVLAVHNYYQGLVNRVWASGDGFYGIIGELKMSFSDGSEQVVVTDQNWRCRRCEAYVGRRMFGYETQFAEDIDQRLFPPGNWLAVEFDDSAWTTAESIPAGRYPHKLMDPGTPPLHLEIIRPQAVSQTAPDAWLFDFGKETVGHTIIRLPVACGTKIEVRHAEELDEKGRARYRMRANCEYTEVCTFDGSGEQIEFYDYKGFRYVELVGLTEAPEQDAVTVRMRQYPYNPDAGKFSCSNETFNRIWEICRHAVVMGTQDAYLDCPTREKGAYLGDAVVTGLAHLMLTGDARILKKVLADFASSTVYCPGMKAVAGCSFMQDIADYSLMWTPLLREYYMWTGDIEFVREMMPVVDGIVDFFSVYEGNYGLLVNFTSKPIMVDWPQNLRDDYDDPALMSSDKRQDRINTVINLYYCSTVDAAGWLLAACGHDRKAEQMVKKSDRIRHALLKYLCKDGLMVDTDMSSHASLHANALAMYCNLPPSQGWDKIVGMVAKKRLNCGVFFAYFVLQGLYNIGEADLAYELMTGNDEHSWQTMLNAGATSCLEAWGPDQKWNTSWCHPWGSAPVILTATEIFGLRPASPGWKKVKFHPQLPTGLKSASLRLTTPLGVIDASFVQNGNTADFTIKAPADCVLACRFQRRFTKVTVNGRPVVERNNDSWSLESRFSG